MSTCRAVFDTAPRLARVVSDEPARRSAQDLRCYGRPNLHSGGSVGSPWALLHRQEAGDELAQTEFSADEDGCKGDRRAEGEDGEGREALTHAASDGKDRAEWNSPLKVVDQLG